MVIPTQLKFKVSLVFQSSKRQVLLPTYIDYGGLLAYVEKKFDIICNNYFSISYKCGSEIFEVKDQDDVQFFVNEVCGKSDIVQKLIIKKIKDLKEVTVVVPPVNDFDLNVSLFPNDYVNEPDNLLKWQLNTFTHMPIPPSPPKPYLKISRVDCHGIKIGDDFDNKNECMYAIGVKSLREYFQYVVIKSCPLRYSVKCAQPYCKWNVYTRTVKNDWKIDISYKRAWGGRNIALKMMNGSHEDLFSQLPYYCYNLKLENEGTVTHIHTDDDGRFEMLYVGFGFAIRSFLRYMRPLIIIDGAHLKGNYSGTNLLAVGMDGNNQILPLATGCLMVRQAFNKAIFELRVYRPEAVNKLEQAEAPVHELSDWASAKVYDIMLKSAKWTVKGIDHLQLYQVCNTKEVHQVDLLKFECTCRKWQLFGIPCGHVCVVCRVSGLTNYSLWAKPWFTKTTLKDTYQELVYPLKDPKLWETPNDLQVVLPPIMNKRPPGRLKNKDRIRSTNEAPTLASCTRCGMNGHNRNGCNQPFPCKYVSSGKKIYDTTNLTTTYLKTQNT
ncbi:transposase, MuDR, MULE transposase domain protein [Tanacetum coccineum]